MDSKSIDVFLTIEKEGSFRKAAETLGYTQAGISYIVQAMEEELGLTLFLRDRKGVNLSPEGKVLLPKIRQLAADNRNLQVAVNELKGLEQGTVRVQIFDSMSIHWLPGILHEFKKDYPGVTVEFISEEDNVRAEEMVWTGEVDCGFFLKEAMLPLETFLLKEEEFLAIVSPEHEMASEKVFPVSKLGDYPYIAMKYDHNTGVRDFFERNSLVPDIAYQVDNDYAAMAMVSKNLGYCIFPELLLQDFPYEICQIPMDDPYRRKISIATLSMKTASTACRKFIEYSIRWVEDNVK